MVLALLPFFKSKLKRYNTKANVQNMENSS
jgi:hypothetical protein